MSEEEIPTVEETPKWPVDSRGAVTITLEYPLNSGGLKTLRVRRPTAGDVRKTAAIKDDFVRGVAMAQELTGLAEADFDQLDVRDMLAIMGVANGMQNKSPK